MTSRDQKAMDTIRKAAVTVCCLITLFFALSFFLERVFILRHQSALLVFFSAWGTTSALVWVVHQLCGDKFSIRFFDVTFAVLLTIAAPILLPVVIFLAWNTKGAEPDVKITRKRAQQSSIEDDGLTIGDAVEFQPSNHAPIRGIVAQINRKTVRVVNETPGVYWNVPPELLKKIRARESAPRSSRQLELIKGQGEIIH